MSLIPESTKASNNGIAAPPERPKTYSTPCSLRLSMTASAPVNVFLAIFITSFLDNEKSIDNNHEFVNENVLLEIIQSYFCNII
jgi:hypothetical protein